MRIVIRRHSLSACRLITGSLRRTTRLGTFRLSDRALLSQVRTNGSATNHSRCLTREVRLSRRKPINPIGRISEGPRESRDARTNVLRTPGPFSGPWTRRRREEREYSENIRTKRKEVYRQEGREREREDARGVRDGRESKGIRLAKVRATPRGL